MNTSFAQELKDDNFELNSGIKNESFIHREKQGPYLLGILPNTHLFINWIYTTEYISRGKLAAHDSFQANVLLKTDNPWVDQHWNSKLYFIYFANYPLNDTNVSIEMDYTVGVNFLPCKTYWDSPIILDAGYIYYTYPLSGVAFNRSNTFYVGCEIQWPLISSNVYVYYDVTLEKVIVEGRLIYNKPLNTFIGCVSPKWNISVTGFAGYWNAEAANGDQLKNGAISLQNGYAYAGIIGLLNYRLNDYVRIGTGFTWAINNDNSYKLGHDSSTLAWNMLCLFLEY